MFYILNKARNEANEFYGSITIRARTPFVVTFLQLNKQFLPFGKSNLQSFLFKNLTIFEPITALARLHCILMIFLNLFGGFMKKLVLTTLLGVLIAPYSSFAGPDCYPEKFPIYVDVYSSELRGSITVITEKPLEETDVFQEICITLKSEFGENFQCNTGDKTDERVRVTSSKDKSKTILAFKSTIYLKFKGFSKDQPFAENDPRLPDLKEDISDVIRHLKTQVSRIDNFVIDQQRYISGQKFSGEYKYEVVGHGHHYSAGGSCM